MRGYATGLLVAFLVLVFIAVGLLLWTAPSPREACEAKGGTFTDSTWSTSCRYPQPDE